jgi:ketosteroid isomerase-like protein
VSDRHAAWITAYEGAWRTAGTATLTRLFTDDATYTPAPFDDPLVGLKAIAEFWEDEREGPDEVFTLSSEIVAAQGDTAVARLEVVYGDPPQRTYRDLWIITLASDGRCRRFEEWPFHPDQARTAL